MASSRLTIADATTLIAYATALESLDRYSDTEFQKVFQVTKREAVSNVAKCLRRYVANRTGEGA